MDMSEILQLQRFQHFVLPGNSATDKLIVPLSGGADSTSLAILLREMFPHVDFDYCFTDTKAEEPEIYETLNSLERYLKKPITRIVPEKGLFELIEQFNGFLPGPTSRWCTRELKLRSFSNWIKQFDGIQKYVFVGIRADESNRLAFTLDQAETVMPFVEMGVRREDVFALLEKTIGIPRMYRRRSRSGCSVCPFQRRSELVGLSQEKPIEFVRGMKYEKLSAADLARHQEATPLSNDSGIAPNWLTLPKPANEAEIKGRKPKTLSFDLFRNRGVFVGGEFFVDAMFGEEFVWHQRVVSFSPTFAGIRRQLDDRYQHLLATGEVYGMSQDEVRHCARFAVWYVELPESVFDPDPPKGEGYTWQQNSSYAWIRHVTQWATRALHAEGMRQEASKRARPLSVQEEWVESAQKGLSKISEEVGQVTVSQWYQPSEKEAVSTEEEEVALLPCPMCHI
jgi:hypothetical protein